MKATIIIKDNKILKDNKIELDDVKISQFRKVGAVNDFKFGWQKVKPTGGIVTLVTSNLPDILEKQIMNILEEYYN